MNPLDPNKWKTAQAILFWFFVGILISGFLIALIELSRS